MYQTIICAIENSKEGLAVLKKATALAELTGAKLFVTHVIAYSLLPKDYQKELQDEVKPALEKMIEKFDISKKNLSVKFGKPYEQICMLAEKKNADLIIIGTHSKKGLHALLGSTANAVANHAHCDVSLVKI